VDARRQEDSAAARVELQADDHSLPAAGSDEPSLQVVDWSPDDSALARADWLEERVRVYLVEPRVVDWFPDDSAPARDDWPEERVRVYLVEPRVADWFPVDWHSALDDSPVQAEQDDCSVELSADDSPAQQARDDWVAPVQADLVQVHARLRQVERPADFPAGSPAE
jgi:hypothetical protein